MKPFLKQQLSTFFDCLEHDTSNYKMFKETFSQYLKRADESSENQETIKNSFLSLRRKQ
jgi:hypothetical protein